MSDLALKFKFVDRGGSKVYDAYAMHDAKKMQKPLFEIRIHDENVQWYANEPTESPDINDRMAGDYKPSGVQKSGTG